MLIKYSGPAGRRIVGEHEWNKENDFLTDVPDADLVTVLLTEPRGGFEVDEEDPLAVLIGSAQVAGELALHGIVKPKDLPKAGSKRGRELAEQFSSTELRQALGHLRGERHVTVAVKDSGSAADEV